MFKTLILDHLVIIKNLTLYNPLEQSALYQSALDVDLSRYIDRPVQKLKDDLYASIDLEGQPTFLAINRDESKYRVGRKSPINFQRLKIGTCHAHQILDT